MAASYATMSGSWIEADDSPPAAAPGAGGPSDQAACPYPRPAPPSPSTKIPLPRREEYGVAGAVELSPGLLALVERLALEPCVFAALAALRASVLGSGLRLVGAAGGEPLHPLRGTVLRYAEALVEEIAQEFLKFGFVLLRTRPDGVLGEVLEVVSVSGYRLSYRDARGGRRYTCRRRAADGVRAAGGAVQARPAQPRVSVVEYRPFRPGGRGQLCSPLGALLEHYALRLQVEDLRLAYSLDHSRGALVLGRRREGNVDRAWESWLLPGAAAATMGASEHSHARGEVPAKRQRTLRHAGDSFLCELACPPLYKYQVPGQRSGGGGAPCTSVAGTCVTRDNTNLVYAREAIRPEHEVSYTLWSELVARVLNLPGPPPGPAPAAPEGAHQRARDSGGEVERAHEARARALRAAILELVNYGQTLTINHRCRALLSAARPASQPLRAGGGLWDALPALGGPDAGAAEPTEAELREYWWSVEALPPPASAAGLDTLLSVLALSSRLAGPELDLLRALYPHLLPAWARTVAEPGTPPPPTEPGPADKGAGDGPGPGAGVGGA